jgi:predicted nucleotidyltransferase component of viral defense system
VIPAANITAWAGQAPWPTRDQVEQDLVLSRLIVMIAEHDLLGSELVFRGGTCLHKLHLPAPLRYSEDLDYVRTTSGGIAPVTRALTEIGEGLGFDVSTNVSTHPKVRYRGQFTASGSPMRVKVEINTHERETARSLIRLPHAVESPWWSGQADVLTFVAAELVATKIRALYQRRKGRDLFDLWLALTQMELDPAEILDCFEPYRPDGYTQALAVANFDAKVDHVGFRTDLETLVQDPPAGYSIDDAAALVRAELIERV